MKTKAVSLNYVRTLVGGSAFSQALGILALPILTRIYSPDDFNVLAVYIAFLTILSVSACLRLEIAIPLSESDEDGINVLSLALFFSFIVSILLLIFVWLLEDFLISALKQPNLEKSIWLIPVGVWFASSYSALQYWTIRKKRFSEVAITRIIQSSSSVGFQTSAGMIISNSIFLVLGHMISAVVGVFYLIWKILKSDINLLKNIQIHKMQELLFYYKKFPLYSTIEEISNNASTQLPLIMIATLSIGPEAGFLFIARRATITPIRIFGGAISQVYLSQAPEALRQGHLTELTESTIHTVMKYGVGLVLALGVISPPLFSLLLGEEWRRVGELSLWMSPWLALLFLSFPITNVMHVCGQQKLLTILMMFSLIVRISATYLGYLLTSNIMSELFAISCAITTGISFIFYLSTASVSLRMFINILFKSSPFIIIQVVLGCIFRYLLDGCIVS